MTTTSKTATHRRQNGKANGRVHSKSQHRSNGKANGKVNGRAPSKAPTKANGQVNGTAPATLTATAEAPGAPAPEAVVLVESIVAEPAVPVTGTPDRTAEAPAPAPAATTPAPVATEEEPPPPPETEPILPGTQRMEFRILLTKSRAIIGGLEAPNAPLAALLAELNIGPERLAACTSLCDAVEAALAARQEAMSNEKTAVKNMRDARHLLDVAYATFRQVARTVYPDSERDAGARRALGLDMPVVDSTPVFANLAREALTAAQREPYATQLAAANFDADRIEEMLALVTVLEMLIQARQLAHRAALDATIMRDATVAELRRAMRQLKLDVQSILRVHPEINPPANFS